VDRGGRGAAVIRGHDLEEWPPVDQQYESRYHALERTQWWCVARRDLVRRIVSRLDRRSRVLEIGSSSGLLLEELRREGFADVFGSDVSAAAVRESLRNGIRRVAIMDGAALAVPDGSFDLLVASDVLEHIEDDRAALAEWRRALRPSGTLVVFVPAFPHLWGEHDELNRHFRRYTKSGLLRRLEESGFKITRASYWNALLFFPASAVRSVQRAMPRAGSRRLERMERIPGAVNALLRFWLKMENRWISRRGIAPGMSVFAVATKPAPSGA
jgi:SAM-dependent methyltransferase